MSRPSLGSPPEVWLIPVTRGCDRPFTVRRKNTDGDPVNWNAALWIDVDINKTAPTRVTATVTDDVAQFVLSDTVCDQVRTGTRWRILMSVGEIQTALAVGTFERHDG